MRRIDKKGFVKGLTTVSIVIAVALTVIFTVFYVFTAFASVSLSSNNAVYSNATFDTNQTRIDLNLTINLTGLGNGQIAPIQAIDINLSQAGFSNISISTSDLVCPNNVTTWTGSSPLTGVVRCANTTGNTLTGVVQIRIANLTASPNSGPQSFNVSAKYNSSMLVENSTMVTITILQLSASASINDTTSQRTLQRSYNFTIINNATDSVYFDTINEINILYTNSDFVDPVATNVTCPKIPAGTGVQWDKVLDTTNNIIRCSKPTAAATLGKDSSTNIIIENWHAASIAGTKPFDITVNGTAANGTYTLPNQNRPSVIVNGTISISGKSLTPSTVAVNATNATIMLYNFTTVGEQFNITVIKVTRSGTTADADFDGVKLYNDTDKSGTLNAGDAPVFNSSSTTTDGQYLFTGISFIVNQNQTLLLVANISGAATASRTYRFNINATSDIDSLGGSSGANVTETINSGQSNQGTIYGTLVVKGFNLAPVTKAVNTANLAVAYFEFNATGEGMNITAFNITRTGSATDSDIVLVRLFNDTNANAAFDAGTDVQLGPAQNVSSVGALYNFTGFQFNVSTGGINRIFAVVNISSATGGRTFSLGLNRTGDINVTGASSGEVLTGSTNISFVSAQSGTTTIHGTLSVTGKALNANTTSISTAGIAALLLNFTASGETINITQINLTRTGSVTDGDGIFNVSLYNDTDRSGTFNTGDLAITSGTANALNTTTAGGYIFLTLNNGNGYNVTTAGSSLLVVVTTNGSASTGGKTFNLSLNSTGSVHAFTALSNVNITGSSNITLTTTNGNLTTIFGTLAVSGSDLTPTTASNGQLGVPILKLIFTATGEQMNITQLNISLNNTNNDDVAAIKLYNDTDDSGTINAGDFLVATAVKTGSVASFGTGTSQLFNVSATADKRLIVAFDISTTATGGNFVDANLSIAGHLLVLGSSSALSITATGLPINPAGETQTTTLAATATIDLTTTIISSSDNYNFTIQNTGGEEIDSIMIDYTTSGFSDIAAITSITCPSIAAGAWTKTINNDTNTINCTSPGSSNNIAVSGKTNITVKNFPAPISAGSKTFTAQVRGTSGGFYNATTNAVTVSGLMNVTGTNKIASKVAVNSKNVSVISYKFIASGEQMNVSVIKLTRAGTSREVDVASVKLFNDTDGDSAYTATADTTQIGSTLTGNNTGGQYEFTGLTFFVPTSGNMTLFAVVELAGTTTTGGKTLILNLNGTADVNAIGSTTGVNVTENLTGTASTESTIFSTLTVVGKNLAATTVGFNTSGLAVMQLNFTTVGGEQINITDINLTRLGTVADGDIFNVSLYNDTDSSGTFNAGDVAIGPVSVNISTAGLYRFSSMNFNLTTTTKTLIVVVSINDTNAGSTFNLSINATGNINAFATTSNTNLTGSTNITLTTATSSTVTIAGGFSITGKNMAPATKVINTAGLPILQINFTAIGEGMNISVIKITRKGSATDNNMYNVSLYNDTDLSGTFNAGDIAIGTVGLNATSSSQYAFTGFQYNITSGGTKTLLIVISTNSTAGSSFNLSLNATDDINTIAATTAQNVTEVMSGIESSTTTIHGTIAVTGKTIAPATKVINSADLAVLQLNFTATGEAMNVSLVNFSLVGTATEANLTNMRLFNDTDGNGQFGSGTDTLISPVLNTTGGALVAFKSLTHIINTDGVNTLFVVVNVSGIAGTGGKTLNFSINNTGDIHIAGRSSNLNLTGSTNITLTTPHSAVATTIYGLMQIRGKNLAISATTPPTANFSVLLLNITATGEGMNITVLNITRMGTATDGNLTNLRIFNDTDLSGTFSGGDEQVFGAVSSSTAGMYKFNGAQFNVSAGSDKTLILVLNVTSAATGAATFNFSINNTGDINVITEASNINITGTANITLTSTLSSTTAINAISIVGTDLIAADPNKNAGLGGFYEIPSVEGNVAAMRINFTSSGEGMNITLIKLVRGNGTGSVTDAYIVNARLFNDTNANGKFDSGTDTQIGSAVSTTSAEKYEFTGFQYNTTTSGVNSLFVVFNTSDLAWNPQGIMFNLSLASTGDINTLGAVTGANLSETLTTVSIATTRITQNGWYNDTQLLDRAGAWNRLFIPKQSMLEDYGKSASGTGNFNFTSILSSIGSNWNYMYYYINGTGWALATRTDFTGSTLKYLNNTNNEPYWINITAVDRFEI